MIEGGQGTFRGIPYSAGSITTEPDGSTDLPQSGDNVILSVGGMANSDGLIPVISGEANNTVTIQSQEDRLADQEENHPAESIGYWIIGQ